MADGTDRAEASVDTRGVADHRSRAGRGQPGGGEQVLLRDDFGVGRRLTTENLRALRRIGAATNGRFLATLGEGEPGAPDAATLQAVVMPSEVDGFRAPGLRFGDPRVMALLAALASLSHVAGGLTNAGLCRIMAGLWEPTYSSRKATYDLRRLRRKGFVERVEGTNTYHLTSHGRSIACFLTKVAARGCRPSPSSKRRLARVLQCLGRW